MNIPELIIVEEVLPEVRRSVSLELTDRGWSQSRIANVLSTSQAMISKYLRDGTACRVSLCPVVEYVSRDVLLGILAGENNEEISGRFCSSLDMCIDRGLLTNRFKERFGLQPHQFCFRKGSRGARSMVLKDMTSALSLLRGYTISDLIPAIKINIVQSIDDPASIEDVASFPGRLMDRNGTITGANPPEFGTSHHLAQTLLWAMEGNPTIRAAASVAYPEKVREVIPEEGSITMIPGKRDPKGSLSMMRNGHYLCDPGDFGVEPCLYIFGTSSLDVAMKIIELQQRMNRKEE